MEVVLRSTDPISADAYDLIALVSQALARFLVDSCPDVRVYPDVPDHRTDAAR